jgi:hypothetical protein
VHRALHGRRHDREQRQLDRADVLGDRECAPAAGTVDDRDREQRDGERGWRRC